MKLIFIYNSDAGFINTILDISHKLFAPASYSCNLCELTHGYFTVREDWKQFISELGNTFNIESEFIHRDEFVKFHGSVKLKFPLVLKETDGKLEILLNRSEIEELRTPGELMNALRKKLRWIS